MNEEEIKNEITNIFKETFPELKEKELELDKHQNDFENWDSFAHMEIVGKVEEKFKVSLEMDEVISLETPRKFIEIIVKKTNWS